MTTAITDVLKEDLATPADPFDFGSGRIDVKKASAVALTLDETAVRFAALGGDPLTAIHLNIPSINAPVMPGIVTTTRVVKNTTSKKVDVKASASEPSGSEITISPSKAKINPGQTATFTITIESEAPIGVQQFGKIKLEVKNGADLHLPVAFIHTQGAVSLSQSCIPDSIVKNATSTCDVVATNQGFTAQAVDLTTTVDSKLKILSATGATVASNGKSATLDGVTLAGAAPSVPSVAPGTTPAGFLPLSLFGIAPVAMGDEDMVNFNVPAFSYGGEAYSSIGVDSNGYLVVGGGTAEDNNCCNLPAGPDAAPPNNVLAPFWSDLDGTLTAGIYVGTLTDGVNTWIVVEWATRVWGTTDIVPMQVWLRTGATQGISFSYDPADLPTDPAGQDFLVGAENKIGQGDMGAVLPTADLVVTSSPSTPGQSATYSLVVRGQSTGTGHVITSMQADGVLGTTIVESKIRVRNR
jgi:hypothetical protein